MKNKIKSAINLFKPIVKNTKNWPILILNRLGILKNKILTYKFKNGLEVLIENAKGEYESSGMAMIVDIFLVKTYTPKGINMKNYKTIIDIGANMGIFSIYASINSPNAKVDSFEPFKKHFSKLNKNIRLNNLKNIKTFNLAVSKNNLSKDFFISKTHTSAHSLIKNQNSSLKIKINCISLKEVFEKNKIKKCDFMKIDCEGREYDILYNAPRSIFNKIEKIIIEFDNIDNNIKNGNALKKFLGKKGFKVNIRGENNISGGIYAEK